MLSDVTALNLAHPPVSVDIAVSHASIFWNLSGPMYCCMAMLSRWVLGTSSGTSAPKGLGGRGNRIVMAGALRTCSSNSVRHQQQQEQHHQGGVLKASVRSQHTVWRCY